MPSLLRRTLHALRATHIPYLTPALRGLRPPFRILLTTTKLLCAAHLVVVYLLPSWGTVSGPSMLPLFEIWGQGAVTSRTHAHGRGIVVGDVVKFKLPVSGEGEAIKRVMGMPGDYVLVGSPDRGGEGEMIQVPKGHCWLLGDNLSASRDSRLYGPVPLALVMGKVLYKTGPWPFPWQWDRITNPFEEQQQASTE